MHCEIESILVFKSALENRLPVQNSNRNIFIYYLHLFAISVLRNMIYLKLIIDNKHIHLRSYVVGCAVENYV